MAVETDSDSRRACCEILIEFGTRKKKLKWSKPHGLANLLSEACERFCIKEYCCALEIWDTAFEEWVELDSAEDIPELRARLRIIQQDQPPLQEPPLRILQRDICTDDSLTTRTSDLPNGEFPHFVENVESAALAVAFSSPTNIILPPNGETERDKNLSLPFCEDSVPPSLIHLHTNSSEESFPDENSFSKMVSTMASSSSSAAFHSGNSPLLLSNRCYDAATNHNHRTGYSSEGGGTEPSTRRMWRMPATESSYHKLEQDIYAAALQKPCDRSSPTLSDINDSEQAFAEEVHQNISCRSNVSIKKLQNTVLPISKDTPSEGKFCRTVPISCTTALMSDFSQRVSVKNNTSSTLPHSSSVPSRPFLLAHSADSRWKALRPPKCPTVPRHSRTTPPNATTIGTEETDNRIPNSVNKLKTMAKRVVPPLPSNSIGDSTPRTSSRNEPKLPCLDPVIVQSRWAFDADGNEYLSSSPVHRRITQCDVECPHKTSGTIFYPQLSMRNSSRITEENSEIKLGNTRTLEDDSKENRLSPLQGSTAAAENDIAAQKLYEVKDYRSSHPIVNSVCLSTAQVKTSEVTAPIYPPPVNTPFELKLRGVLQQEGVSDKLKCSNTVMDSEVLSVMNSGWSDPIGTLPCTHCSLAVGTVGIYISPTSTELPQALCNTLPSNVYVCNTIHNSPLKNSYLPTALNGTKIKLSVPTSNTCYQF